jgi:glycosyltransferase involved in cell wall biosynthesis
MDTDYHQSVLFLDKVFLRPRKQTLRGVELFNLSLIRDLGREGIKLTIPIHHSWKNTVLEGLSGPGPELCEVGRRNTLLSGLQAAWRLRRGAYDKIILANVANGLIPALWLLRLFQGRRPLVMFAHRMPQGRFLAALPWPAERVVPVNSIIAGRFRQAGYAGIHEMFGHIDAGRFYPGGPRPATDKVNFCVIGFLDNAWKGADTAVAAFRKMPEEARAGSVLHLVSFRSPRSFPEPNIKVPAWLPVGRMPEWLRGMDVMIVPSRDEGVMRETFSLTMVEGMLTGLPIIASSLPVLAEKIATGGGYVFHTMEELASLMTSLARDAGLRARLGAQAREIALARYVWDTKRFVRECLG